jgi:hypothetical protein
MTHSLIFGTHLRIRKTSGAILLILMTNKTVSTLILLNQNERRRFYLHQDFSRNQIKYVVFISYLSIVRKSIKVTNLT